MSAMARWPSPALGQCPKQWYPGEGIPGVNGTVSAMTSWDPDGSGPLPELLVIGGDFTFAGDVVANSIACWDPTTETRSTLGVGMGGVPYPYVYALSALDGRLYAGGDFTSAGGWTAYHIARWDPGTSAWSTVGSGLNGNVFALSVLDNKVLAGGSFTAAGGVSVNRIASWDAVASTWSALGSGTNGAVGALAMVDGILYAGGGFTIAGGRVSAYWARWGTGPRADFDCDLDVDGDDLDLFETCASGPCIDHNGTPTCQTTDLDADNDVDQTDFGLFQRCLSGEHVVADPHCTG